MKGKLLRPVLAVIALAGLLVAGKTDDARSSETEAFYVEAQKGRQPLTLVNQSAEEWKARLTPEQYRLTREEGTEAPYSGAYWNNHSSGIYQCVCCGTDLFSSNAKFDAGNGWPNFWQPIAAANLDVSGGAVRCRRCGAYIGRAYNDGPKPTGLRYTVNSGSMTFTAK